MGRQTRSSSFILCRMGSRQPFETLLQVLGTAYNQTSMSRASNPENDRISRTSLETIRTSTLNNNLIWLQSFGCEITQYENLIRVDHPQLADYSAWLVFGSPEVALGRLRFLFDETKSMSNAPDIYLDEIAYNPSLNSALSEAGFKCNSLSLTIA